MPPKGESESDLVRKTISLAPDTYDAALRQAAARGFRNSFSAYCAWLIDRDTAGDVAPKIPRTAPAPILSLRVAEDPAEPGK